MKALDDLLERLTHAAQDHCGSRARGGPLRRFLGGVLWILRTGAPWRDLPRRFGSWNTVFRRFRRWGLAGWWAEFGERVRRPAQEGESLLLDSTIIQANPDAAGARGSCAEQEALGRSRGGLTTKVHAVVSSVGRWVTCCLTPGQRADVTQAIALLEPVPAARRVIADRAYDSDAFVGWLAARSVEAVVPCRRGRRHPRPHDAEAYRSRNVIERFFGRLARLRRVGLRTDKTAGSFAAFVGQGALAVERTAWT